MVVAVPEKMYWPLYWVLASCLMASASWSISSAVAERSVADSSPLEACTVSSWARWSMLVTFCSDVSAAEAQAVPSVMLEL